MVLLQMVGAAIALATPIGPAGIAFYTPPSPLAFAKHGDVIWSRTNVDTGLLPSASQNLLVLYHTTSANGGDVAVSGTVAIPKGTPPRDGWPVVSWAHGTTGNAPQCAPSRYRNLGGQRSMLDTWLSHGYAVLKTDYEGQGTPGTHPYFIQAAAAHDVTDMVRAARQVVPEIGTRWIALGHSEGGSAAIATAALGPAWAPELHLVGAISYAPASHITSFLDQMLHSDTPIFALPYFALILQSYGTFDSAVHLERIITPQFLARMADLRSRCVDDLENDRWWSSQSTAQIFLQHPDLGPLAQDFVNNELTALHPVVPVLLLQGTSDTMVSAEITRALDQELCHDAVAVTFDIFKDRDHLTLLAGSTSQALAWTDAAFAGRPLQPNCGSAPSMF